MTKILQQLAQVMCAKGAQRILIKRLANNDNSKNQIYLGSDFDVIRLIPSGDIYSDGMSSKGSIFKAPLKFIWTDFDGHTEPATHAQIILYPDYPETRLSGFLKGCDRGTRITPRHLMQPPTPEERLIRAEKSRFLILGVNEGTIWAFCSAWGDQFSDELDAAIVSGNLSNVATVFHEYHGSNFTLSSQDKLVSRLKVIYQNGEIESCRLDKLGTKHAYRAQNGAGYTLEALFDIRPNGCSDPDFLDWELKAHSGSVVTLMTPEPNIGTYLDDLETFLRTYGTNIQTDRLDFASRHNVGELNVKSLLTMELEGYDPVSEKIVDPEGGLFLRNQAGEVVAGWKFDKIIGHWKNKHANTCFVTYTARKGTQNYYRFGPEITLGKGADLDQLLTALYLNTIYYDPGINMKFDGKKWKPKKRNQFRVHWKNISSLYKSIQHIDLSTI